MNAVHMDKKQQSLRADYIYERFESLCMDEEPAWLEAYGAMTYEYAKSCGRFDAQALEHIKQAPEMFEMLLPNDGLLLSGMLAHLAEQVSRACKQLALNEQMVPIEYADRELPAALTTTFKTMLRRDADKSLAKTTQTR